MVWICLPLISLLTTLVFGLKIFSWWGRGWKYMCDLGKLYSFLLGASVYTSRLQWPSLPRVSLPLTIWPSVLLLIYLKAMATHSSTLAWKILWMKEPGGLQSMGWLGVGHNWETSLSLFTFMHWRRKLQPTPVFLPGESQGRGSLVGCHLWRHTESDMIEVT